MDRTGILPRRVPVLDRAAGRGSRGPGVELARRAGQAVESCHARAGRQADWGHVGAAFGNLQLRWWLLAAGLYYLTQVASSLRWQILARPLGFHRPITQYLSFYFIGMFFNLFLPTSVGGDVVRAWYL